MKKRAQGTGTIWQRDNGSWTLRYKPQWALKRLVKTVEAPTEKAAQILLTDWIRELDKRSAPAVTVSIEDLIQLHLADMRLQGRDPINIEHVGTRARKHLGKYFAEVD